MARRVVTRDADVDREVVVDRGGNGAGLLSWLALLLAITALALAWAAFNRTGEDLEAKIQRQVQQSGNNVQDAVDEETPNNTEDNQNQ